MTVEKVVEYRDIYQDISYVCSRLYAALPLFMDAGNSLSRHFSLQKMTMLWGLAGIYGY